MAEEKKFTIMKALEILQKIRYFDSEGNIVYRIVDETKEWDYLEKTHREYCPVSIDYQYFLKILNIANKLEYLNVLNISNEQRKKEKYKANNVISPIIKIKRKTYYNPTKISSKIDKTLNLK